MECLRRLLRLMYFLGILSITYNSRKGIYESYRHSKLQFAVLLSSAMLGASYVIYRSPIESILYRPAQLMFDFTIYIVNCLAFCAICLVFPLAIYRGRQHLADALNALLQNDLLLRQASGKVLEYKQPKSFEMFVLWNSTVFTVLLALAFMILYKQNEGFLQFYVGVCIYLFVGIALDWTFGLCGLIILIGVAQLTAATDHPQHDKECLQNMDQHFGRFCILYERIVNVVRPRLSAYSGLLVTFYCPLLVFQCAVKTLDSLFPASDLVNLNDRMLFAFGILWLVNDIKKFVVFLIISEILKQKVSYLLQLLFSIGEVDKRYKNHTRINNHS
uniref:Gustatory receptor n=1 Tax=Anopheles darlingi TaxID=43151 RepID=A0A2M4CL13_ANODA